MTDLNLVLVLLGLLATVIIGVIQVTWMIARMSFGTSRAQNIIPMTDKENDRPRLPNLSGHFFDLLEELTILQDTPFCFHYIRFIEDCQAFKPYYLP